MKNTTKIVAIFGIVTSFFPAYSMESSEKPFDYLRINDLKDINPFSLTNSLTISCNTCDKSPDDQLFTKQSLPLELAIIKYLEKPDTETLKSIYTAVSQGIPITSKYAFRPRTEKKHIYVFPCRNPTSIFTLIDNWLKNRWFTNKDKENALKIAIFKGEQKKQEKLAYIRNKLKIEIPELLIPEFLSYLPEYNISEERTELIKQTEKEFYEKKPLLILSKIGTCYSKFIKNRIKNK